MTTKATLEGVEVPEEIEAEDIKLEDPEQAQERALSPREQKIKDIAAARSAELELDQDRAVEQGLIDKPEEETTAEQEETEDTDKPEEAKPTLEESLGLYENEKGELVAKMKISGKEKEIPAAQVKAMMQKELSGDHKLEAAALRQKNLDQREREIQSQVEALEKQVSDKLSTDASANTTAEAKAIISELIDGDSDVAAEKLAELLNGRQQPTLDIDKLTQTITEEAVGKMSAIDREKAIKAGVDKLNEDYSHIMQDPNLRNMADQYTNQIEADHPDWTPGKILVEAAKATEQWVESITGKSISVDRDVDKTKLKPMPSSKARASHKPKKVEIDRSPAAVISRMKRARAV